MAAYIAYRLPVHPCHSAVKYCTVQISKSDNNTENMCNKISINKQQSISKYFLYILKSTVDVVGAV